MRISLLTALFVALAAVCPALIATPLPDALLALTAVTALRLHIAIQRRTTPCEL